MASAALNDIAIKLQYFVIHSTVLVPVDLSVTVPVPVPLV